MHLEVRHLQLVQSVAEEGSVTKAGNRLHLTQSALSHQLRDVEQKLGLQLFTRMNKRMIITPAGERILGAAKRVLDELKRAEEDVRHIALNREGILRISTECYTCYHWLPSLLKAFAAEYPRIEVQIAIEATSNPHQALLDGQIDLALICSLMRNNKIAYKSLFRDELVVLVNNEHPLTAKPFVAPRDFLNEHLIIYSDPDENGAVQQVLVPAGVSPKRISSVQLTEAIVEMVKGGLGIGILSRWSVAEQIASGTLRALPLTKGGTFRVWSAATLKNNSAPPYVQAFIRLLGNNSVLIMSKDKKTATSAKGLRLVRALDCSQTDEACRTA